VDLEYASRPGLTWQREVFALRVLLFLSFFNCILFHISISNCCVSVCVFSHVSKSDELFRILQTSQVTTILAESKSSAVVPDVSDTSTDETVKESTDSAVKSSTARDDDDVKDDSTLSAAAADVTKTSRNAEKKKAKKQKVSRVDTVPASCNFVGGFLDPPSRWRWQWWWFTVFLAHY